MKTETGFRTLCWERALNRRSDDWLGSCSENVVRPLPKTWFLRFVSAGPSVSRNQVSRLKLTPVHFPKPGFCDWVQPVLRCPEIKFLACVPKPGFWLGFQKQGSGLQSPRLC